MQRGKFPYANLGKKLHELRRNFKESLAEVSGAVELETDIIESYEKGETRPSEEILSMLISHFEIKDDDADELWELAGYIEQDISLQPVMPIDQSQAPTVVVVPIDNKIVYTDRVNITANNHGLVMSFMQDTASNGKANPISRVGMSLDHAKKMLEVLEKTIKQAEQANNQQKGLPKPDKNHNLDKS